MQVCGSVSVRVRVCDSIPQLPRAGVVGVFVGLTRRAGPRELSFSEIQLLANLLPEPTDAKTIEEHTKTGLKPELLTEVRSFYLSCLSHCCQCLHDPVCDRTGRLSASSSIWSRSRTSAAEWTVCFSRLSTPPPRWTCPKRLHGCTRLQLRYRRRSLSNRR